MGEVAWGAVFEDIGRRPRNGGEEGEEEGLLAPVRTGTSK